ncbi:CBS domain-containing protein [Faunimonas sp. B44]|uniref:CBS domain-containing protein n=1 Tax=Faunimonas sp. B44 TaxID=3461493 RepID=UPI0040443929
MTAPVISVTPETPVSDIAALLIDRRISGVPVVDAHGHMVGIVSEGDLLRRTETRTAPRRPQWLELLTDRSIQAADFVKTHGLTAADVMTRDVVSVEPDVELVEIAGILERRHIKRVPVVESGLPVGIVSRANLLHGLIAYKPAVQPDGVSDAEIRHRLNEELRGEGWIDLTRLNIVVSDGVVHLWGIVKSEEQSRALEVASEAVPGVRRVENHLAPDRFANDSG